MGVAAQWADITFEITAESALLFKDLKISAESETEDAESNSQGYASYKKGKAASVDFTVDILASFGQDVRAVVTKLLDAAQRGKPEYLYVGGEKIFPAQVIMTKAEASEIKIAPGNKWVRAKVAITMKQAEAAYIIPDPEKENPAAVYYDDGGWSGGGGGGGSKNSTVYMPDTSGYIQKDGINTAGTVTKTAKTTTSAVTPAASTSSKVTSLGGFGR